ncbi:MAG: hypothetical protein K8I00_07360 [Candidatus Omnitrophica bacterium]|nr:hypothetical protein [Candidatus Omnitrophota bacterium]
MTTKVKLKSLPKKQTLSGRQCRHPGCTKRLSIYNAQRYCFVHLRKLAADDFRFM